MDKNREAKIAEIKLPEWGECYKAVQEGIATALQVFIYNNEPAGSQQDKDFREQLSALIEQEQQLMREALQIAQHYVRALAETTLITGFPKELLIEDLAKIDAVLEGK